MTRGWTQFHTTRAFRVCLLLAVAVGLLVVAYHLRVVFTPLLLAFLLAYILDPLVDRFEKARLNRAGAIAVLYVLVIGLLAVIVGGLFAFVLDQVDGAVALAQRGVGEVVREPWFLRLHETVTRRASDEATLDRVAKQIKDNIGKISGGITEVLGYLETQLSNLLNILMYFLLVPLYTFFLLLNFDAIVAAIRNHLPGRYRDRIVGLVHQVDAVLSSFFRRRLIIALIVTLLSGVGFLFCGCPVPFLFGFLVGAIVIVPFASIVVVLVAAAATYLATGGTGGAIAVFVVGVVVQMIEAYALTPWIIGKQLELHFIVILLAAFVFGELFGFFGVLLSVPLAAIAKILGREFLLPILKELAAERPADAEP